MTTMGEMIDAPPPSRAMAAVKQFACGAAAGVAQCISGHPFDTVKVKLQTQTDGKYKGMVHAFRTIIADEGALAVYRGVQSPLIGMAAMNSVVFASNSFIKTMIGKTEATMTTAGRVLLSHSLKEEEVVDDDDVEPITVTSSRSSGRKKKRRNRPTVIIKEPKEDDARATTTAAGSARERNPLGTLSNPPMVAGTDATTAAHDLFDLDEDDTVQHSCECYFLMNSLLPGQLFVTKRYVCFFASATNQIADIQGKQDYLLKSGDLKWNRRWVVLNHDRISYYRSSDPSEQYEPLNQIPLDVVRDVRALKPSAASGYKHCFRIYTTKSDFVRSRKKEIFHCDSHRQLREWVQAIRLMALVCQNRHVTFKRRIEFASVSSVNLAESSIFPNSVSLLTNADDVLFFTHLPDIEKTYKHLTLAWINAMDPDAVVERERSERMAVEEAGRVHKAQNEFIRLFRVDERVRHVFHVSVMTHITSVTVAGRLFITDRLLCFHCSSWMKKALLMVPLTSIRQVLTFNTFLVVDNGLSVVTDEKTLSFVLPISKTKEIRAVVRDFHERALASASSSESGAAANASLSVSSEQTRASGSSLATPSTSQRSRSAELGSSRVSPRRAMLVGDLSAHDDNDEIIDDFEQINVSDSIPSAPLFYSTRKTEFHDLFPSLPLTEPLLAVYQCGLNRSEKFYDGKLFHSENFLCFGSKGKQKMSCVIPFECITDVKVRMRSGGILIRCDQGDDEFYFSGFSDDSASVLFNTIQQRVIELKVAGATASASETEQASGGGSGAEQQQQYAVAFYHANNSKFRRLFGLVDDDLIEDFSCSLMRTLPVKGQLYVSERHICFSAVLLGKKWKVVIPFADVVDVRRERSLRLFDCIDVTVRNQQQWRFGQFSHCTQCYQLLRRLFEKNAKASDGGPAASLGASVDNLNLSVSGSASASRSAMSKSASGTDIAARLAESINDAHFVPKPMQVVIMTIGSRGDVQPFIALSKALQADGHKVAIATHAEFKEFVERNEIEHRLLAGDPKLLMDLCVSNGMFTPQFIREALSTFRGFIDELLRTAWLACQGADLIIQTPPAMAGFHVAERLNVPLYMAFTMPFTKTKAFPNPFAVVEMPLGGAYNYMTHVFVEQAYWQPLRGQVNKFRAEIGLAPLGMTEGAALAETRRVPFLYCFSRHLLPKPRDWASQVHITGFWFLDSNIKEAARAALKAKEESGDADAAVEPQLASATANASSSQYVVSGYEPPKELRDFLAHPDKPIYVGFGSITGIPDPDQFIANVLGAIERTGLRCILLSGWADIGAGQELSDRILPLKSVPHDWLFPQCSAVVHHGGAGTLAAGLRANCPTVVVAFFGDQFMWSERVEELKVGRGMSAKNVTIDKLSAAILETATDKGMAERAAVLGRSIREENGLEQAVRLIYRYLPSEVARGEKSLRAYNEESNELKDMKRKETQLDVLDK